MPQAAQTDKSTKQQAVPGDVLKQQTNSVDYSFRIVVLGDCGVGKSSLINDEINDGQQQQQQQRTATGEKQQAVVNNQQPLLSIHNKTFLVNGQHCQIQLWDHNGSPTFHRFTNRFIAGAAGAICLFDVNRPETFHSVEQWIERLKQHGGHRIPFLIAGRLSQQQQQQQQQSKQPPVRLVGVEQGKRLAEQHQTEFYEITDPTSQRQLFMSLLQRILDQSAPHSQCPRADRMLNRGVWLGDRYTDPQLDTELIYRRSLFTSSALNLLPAETTPVPLDTPLATAIASPP